MMVTSVCILVLSTLYFLPLLVTPYKRRYWKTSEPSIQNEIQVLNVTDRKMCFLHVGKTSGSSFRTQFANGRKRIAHPRALPALKVWKEFHTNDSPPTNESLQSCDYVIAWVRNPIERLVSAYNMVFNQEWYKELSSASVKSGNLLLKTRETLESYGSLSDLAEQISKNNTQAQMSLGKIEHVKYNHAYYFNAMFDKDGTTNEAFLQKLVFIGSTECYEEDIKRFASLFNVSNEFISGSAIAHMRKNNVTGKNLSQVATHNLQSYLHEDYKILNALMDLDLIPCERLQRQLRSWREGAGINL